MPGGWSGITLSQAELAHITAKGVRLQTDDAQSVRTVAVDDTDTIDGIVSFYSKDTSVTFETGASNFVALSAEAKCGVTVNIQVSTTDASKGDLFLDGDKGSCGVAANGKITIGDQVTLHAAKVLTLKADNSGTVQSGLATLKADSGIVLNSAITNTAGAPPKNLVLHVNSGSASGTLSISSTRIITTGNHNLVVTVGDIDLSGGINTGTGLLDLYANTGKSIQLGTATPVGLSLAGAELQRITTSGGFRVSGSNTFTASGVRQANSAFIQSSLSLIATGSHDISFTSAGSTFHTLYAEAVTTGRKISVARKVTTTTGINHLKGGTIAISANADLEGAEKVKLEVTESAATATAPVNLVQVSNPAASASSLGIHIVNGLHIAGTGSSTLSTQGKIKLQSTLSNTNTLTTAGPLALTATDLILDAVSSHGIQSGNSQVKIYAPQSGTQPLDIGLGQATSLKTNSLLVTGNEISRISSSSLTFVGGAAADIKAGGVLSANTANCGTITLKSSNEIEFNTYGSTFQALVLEADSGMHFKKPYTADAAPIILNADHDANGAGVLTVDNLVTLAAPGQGTTIIASDIELIGSGGIGSTTSTVTVTTSTSNNIGLGGTAKDMHLTDTELSRVTATDLTVGNNLASSMTVNGVSLTGTSKVSNLVTLVSNQGLAFSGSSIFPSLHAHGPAGVTISGALTTTTGALTLDGDTDSNGSHRIHFAAGAAATAKTTMTLKPATGGGLADGTLALQAGNGIHLECGMSLTSASAGDTLTLNADTTAAAGTGAAVVVGGVGISTSNGQAVYLTAADLDMGSSAYVRSTGGNIQLDSTAQSTSVGSVSTTAAWQLSLAELQRITSTNLKITNQQAGTLHVGAFVSTDTAALQSVFLVSKADVAFEQGSSTFYALSVQADTSITLSQSVHATDGGITLTANSDGAGAAADNRVTLSSNTGSLTLRAAKDKVEISAQTGGISNQGLLTLQAKTGVALQHSLTSQRNVFVMADSDNTSPGKFTLATGAVVTSGNNNLIVEASHMDLDGSIDCGSGNLTLKNSVVGQPINLGASTSDFDITDAEMGRVSASQLTVGNSNNGHMLVTGLTTTNSHISSKLILKATRASSEIRVTGATQIQATLEATANSGIHIQQNMGLHSLAILNSDSTAAGSGKLTIASGMTLTTNNQRLVVTSSDVVLDGKIAGGTGSVLFGVATDGRAMGVDPTAVAWGISPAELQRITSTGLVIGNLLNGDLTVKRVESADGLHVSGIVTLMAMKTGARVLFSDSRSSTFNALSVQSSAGMILDSGITATVGNVVLDGGLGSTAFTTALTLVSQDKTSLKSALGIDAQSTLGMNANNGININSHLVSTGALTINADADSSSGGSLRIPPGANVSSSNNLLRIIASDIELEGYLSAGTAALQLETTSNQIMALGASSRRSAGTFGLSTTELSHLQSTGATFGGSVCGNITVMALGNSLKSIRGIVTLSAPTASARISFSSGSSTFHSLAAQASNGIDIWSNVFSSTGGIDFNADVATDGTHVGPIRIFDDRAGSVQEVCNNCERNIVSASTMKWFAADGGVQLIGNVTGNATAGFELKSAISGHGGTVKLNADSDHDGVGVMQASAGITLLDQDLEITASDLAMSSPVKVGTANISLQASYSTVVTVGTYVAPAGAATLPHRFDISQAELELVNSSNLIIGDSRNKGMLVSQVAGLGVSIGWVVLKATNRSSNVTFLTGASTFPNLEVAAGSGVHVLTNISTKDCDILADQNKDGSGLVEISASSTLSVSGTRATLTCSDLYLNGWLNATSADLRIQPAKSKGTARIGQSTTTADIKISRDELDRLIAKKFIFGGRQAGDISVGSLYKDDIHSKIQHVVVAAQTTGSRVSFEAPGGSNFPGLEVRAHNGVIVKSNITTHGKGNIYINADDNAMEDGGNSGPVCPGFFTPSCTVEQMSDVLRIASGVVLNSDGSLILVSGGGIWPEGPITLKSRCGIDLRNPIRGPWVEFVTYETGDGCSIKVASDGFEWRFFAGVVLLCCCAMPCVYSMLSGRAPKKPLGDLALLVVPDDGSVVGEFWDTTCTDTPEMQEDDANLLLEEDEEYDKEVDTGAIHLEMEAFGSGVQPPYG